jgi:hypothetical protein
MKLHRGTRRRHQQSFWVRRKARYALRQTQLGWAGKSMTIQVLANVKGRRISYGLGLRFKCEYAS